ncbi:MAG: hypothetical protein IPJ18_21660 [Betaproteobacteria bacterium]|nr:hypothetical protein [Betaproteobacteria bacterium]
MSAFDHLVVRKGAAKIALIPGEVLVALNAGQIPTLSLNEFLAIDLTELTVNVARQIGIGPQSERLQVTLAILGAFKPMKRHLHIARARYDLTAALPHAEPFCDRSAFWCT